MTTHQDTSTERERFEKWYVDHCPDIVIEPIGCRTFVLQWKAWQAALASRDEAAVPSEIERLRAEQIELVMPQIGPLLDAWESAKLIIRAEAPKLHKILASINRSMEYGEAAQQQQRQTPDHSKLLKMIAHRARCFPSYPMGYHLPEVFAAVGEAPPEHTVLVPQGQAICALCDGMGYQDGIGEQCTKCNGEGVPKGQAVSDEQIDAVLKDIDRVARDYEVYEYGLPLQILDSNDFPQYKNFAEGMRKPIRAILALRDKPDHFPDAAKMMPLSDERLNKIVAWNRGDPWKLARLVEAEHCITAKEQGNEN